MQQRKLPIRLIIMLGFIAFSAIKFYFGSSQKNPITGETQRVSLTPEQEVAMGLQSAPEMAAQFGGLYPDDALQLKVRSIGQKLLRSSNLENTPYKFNFYALADNQTVNAFALPGGQIFITMALVNQLKTDDEIAGVLGHEIGHVVNRHSAEHMAKSSFISGIVNGVVMGSGSMSGAQVASYVGQMMNLKYGRNDELESDKYGIKYMYAAGYNPAKLIDVMEVLAKAGGGRGGSDFMSSHPSPENRVAKIKEELAKLK
jgi:beta-barrel assembly-enhancing protease